MWVNCSRTRQCQKAGSEAIERGWRVLEVGAQSGTNWFKQEMVRQDQDATVIQTYNHLSAQECVSLRVKGPLRRCPEDAKASWRADPGSELTLPRTLRLPSVTGPDTLVCTALPGRILTFVQGPLARSVTGGSGCQLLCAGTTRTALPAQQRPRSLQPTAPAHGLVRRVLG